MSCVDLGVPLTLTVSVGEPPDCPARASSTTSCKPESAPKVTGWVAVAPILENLSALPFWYMGSLTTEVPVSWEFISSP
jgi:hypothetical protein